MAACRLLCLVRDATKSSKLASATKGIAVCEHVTLTVRGNDGRTWAQNFWGKAPKSKDDGEAKMKR